MRILLTGTSGQLGQALAARLTARHTLITPGRTELDLAHPERVPAFLAAHAPELILNPAAYTAVDRAESEAALAYAINAEAPRALAEYARRAGIGLVHFSTDYVFDGSKQDAQGRPLAYTEEDACAPLNVYGASKYAGEQAVRDSGAAHLLLRTSWVYSLSGKNFLLTMLRLAETAPLLKVVDDQWGAPTPAGWLAEVLGQIVDDLAGCADPAAWWRTRQGLYHLTTSGCTTWCEFARTLLARAFACGMLQRPPPEVLGIPGTEYPTPARRPRCSCLDGQRFDTRFALPRPHWESALHACLRLPA